ncbi:MAG: hypothetical protein AAB863_01135 [Patescibacteria group bacterium]
MAKSRAEILAVFRNTFSVTDNVTDEELLDMRLSDLGVSMSVIGIRLSIDLDIANLGIDDADETIRDFIRRFEASQV